MNTFDIQTRFGPKQSLMTLLSPLLETQILAATREIYQSPEGLTRNDVEFLKRSKVAIRLGVF